MPRATVSQEAIKYPLDTLPAQGGEEEGFVTLRTLSFHEMNMRQDMAGRMYQEHKAPKRGQKQTQEEIIRGYFESMNVAVTEYEFRNCIVDHNLTDENGDAIDFARPMAAWRLDPKVGAEIGKLIDDLNQSPEDDDVTPLATARSSSLQAVGSTHESSSETT